MLLFGGYYNKKSFYSFNLTSQQWKNLTNLPSNRIGHRSIVVNNSIFIVGGFRNKNVDEFDNSTKSFKTVATMKEARCWFGSCLYKKTLLLVAGGRDDNKRTNNDCFLYNTISKNFKEFASLDVKRWRHVLVNFKEVLYSIGGLNEKNEVLDSIETYEEGNEQWKMCDFKLNIAREGHQAVVHKNYIYIVGGCCRADKLTNTVERIDVNNGKVDLIDVKLRVARSTFTSCKLK